MRPRLLCAAVAAGAFLVPSTASAATICVPPANPAGCDETQPTVQAALTRADTGSAGPDTVRLGATTYNGEFVYAGADEVDIVGTGPSTVLHRSDAGIVLNLSGNSNHSASDLRVSSSAGGSANTGIFASESQLNRVDVEVASGVGVTLRSGAALADSRVTGTAGGVEFGPGGGTMRNTDVRADTIGILGNASNEVRRSTVRAQTAVNQSGGTGIVADTLLKTVSAPGDFSTGANLAPASATPAELRLRNVTIVGNASTQSTGASAFALTGYTATLDIANTIIRNVNASIVNDTSGGGAPTVTTQFSSYDFASSSSILPDSTDIDDNSAAHFVGPALADPAAGDYRLRHDSLLVDAGSATFVDVGATDRRGLARIVDGDGTGGAQPDMGAYEYQRAAPTATATRAPARVVVGRPVSYDGEASDVDGDALTARWAFDDGTAASGLDVSHAWRTPGRHSATLTVTDPVGRSATRTVTVDVVTAPTPGGGGPGGGPGPGTGETRRTCRVPKLKRKKLKTARRLIRRRGCRVGRVRRVRSRTIKKGRVVSQSPRAGRRVSRGRRVNLRVSRGRR